MTHAAIQVRTPGTMIYPEDAVFWVACPGLPDEIRVRWRDERQDGWRWCCDRCGRTRDRPCVHAVACLNYYNNETDKENNA